MAVVYKDKTWQTLAVHSIEIAWGFNVIIVPAYWIHEILNIIRDYSRQDGLENFSYVYAILVHTGGMISSIISIFITKMVFLRKDSKYSLLVGFLYIPVNYYGGFDMYGHPVYWMTDFLNWSNVYATLTIWIL